MTTTCLINNYNYARFISQAIDSALHQTVPFDEIIVVDDGSTDGTTDLLSSRYARHPAIQVVAKPNQGQLSCFNEGFARAKGDILFFLDADDVYEPNYLEQALDVYRRDLQTDFVYCGYRQFGHRDSLQLDFATDQDLGYSVILVACLRNWIGGPTSCLSMRRSVLDKILPLPFLDAWRTRADDCLVFSSSLAGARKYYLAQPLVRYRVHDANRFFGRAPEKLAAYRRRLAINALFAHMERKLGYDTSRLADFHHREFCTIAVPTFRQLFQYACISMRSRSSYVRRLACIAVMAGHFFRTAIRSAQSAPNGASQSRDQDCTVPLRMFLPTDSAADADVSQQRQAA